MSMERVILPWFAHGGQSPLEGGERRAEDSDQAFPGLEGLVLSRVVPGRLDVLNYRSGLPADPVPLAYPLDRARPGPPTP
jgi:hypothetical protein